MPVKKQSAPAPLASVKLTGGLLAQRQKSVLDHSIDQQYQQCKTTGRIDALRLAWKPEQTEIPKPHIFWDSDLGKWIESAAYALTLRPDPELQARVDEVIKLMQTAQATDGYLNSYYQAVEPHQRFTNLRDNHELYCAGHLLEGAVAYFQATGKREMLDVMLRYVDHIDSVFGPQPGKKNGYDGHEEIELALMKLHRVTGEDKHLQLARHFVDARGQQPHFFEIEAVERGETPRSQWDSTYGYWQAGLPVRQQTAAEGHSVRAMYLYAGVADVAAATGDAALLKSCRKVFDNVVARRMYITGGVGSTRHGERFTYDFDLPNETAYAETCAQIALIFFARRMLDIELDSKYADVMERALYNGVLCGASLDGKRYFYANYLATDQQFHQFEGGYPAQRQAWFGCACCPPNYARLLTSIGSYIYSVDTKGVSVHLYTDSTFQTGFGDLVLKQKTSYPWEGDIHFAMQTTTPQKCELRLRLPGWCAKPSVFLNGKRVNTSQAKKGYLTIDREWKNGDKLQLILPMLPRRVYADPRERHNAGRVALMHGPIVYCLEQKDNGPGLAALSVPRSAKLSAKFDSKKLGGVITLTCKGRRDENFKAGALYSNQPPRSKPVTLKFIPYYAWANRGDGEMTVWVRE